jgi:hypothetical protein
VKCNGPVLLFMYHQVSQAPAQPKGDIIETREMA